MNDKAKLYLTVGIVFLVSFRKGDVMEKMKAISQMADFNTIRVSNRKTRVI